MLEYVLQLYVAALTGYYSTVLSRRCKLYTAVRTTVRYKCARHTHDAECTCSKLCTCGLCVVCLLQLYGNLERWTSALSPWLVAQRHATPTARDETRVRHPSSVPRREDRELQRALYTCTCTCTYCSSEAATTQCHSYSYTRVCGMALVNSNSVAMGC